MGSTTRRQSGERMNRLILSGLKRLFATRGTPWMTMRSA
jgi:hypothetical protein